MSLAKETREAARRRPFLVGALRAEAVNYTAAARSLSDEVEGNPESIATALRRFADSLPDREIESRRARVSMKSGLGETDDADDALLAVGGTAFAPGSGSLTGILAESDVDAAALGHVLQRLATEGIEVSAAGVAGKALLVAVKRRHGPDAVRVIEDALEAVPDYERS